MSKREDQVKKLQRLLESIPANMYFVEINALANYLAPLMDRDPTNVKRNVHYRKELDEYLSKQKGAASFVKDKDAEKYILRTQLMAAKIEIAQQRNDIKRLNKAISSILSPLQQSSAENIPKKESSEKEAEDPKRTYDLQLTHAAMAFFSILKWVSDRELGLSPNYKEKIIEDLTCSNINERIVVTKDRAKFYFDFLAMNKDLLSSLKK